MHSGAVGVPCCRRVFACCFAAVRLSALTTRPASNSNNVCPASLHFQHAQVSGDPDLAEDKRRQLPFAEVETLALSFQRLARITSLEGFDRLTKLQLDNNRITQIENLSHLVRFG